MGGNWFVMDLDCGSSLSFSIDPLISHGIRGGFLSQFVQFVDNSVHGSRNLLAPGSHALREAFGGLFLALALWSSRGSNPSGRRKLSNTSHGLESIRCRTCPQQKGYSGQSITVFHLNSSFNRKSSASLIFDKIISSVFGHLFKEAEQLQSLPVLSLGAALVTPFRDLSHNLLPIPGQMKHAEVQMEGCMTQLPSEVRGNECVSPFFADLHWKGHAIEPKTGIEFPTVLDNILSGVHNHNAISEVLVGTGSKTMTIVRIKSLDIYAFGFYIHPSSVREKLGPKYSSVPKVDTHDEFYTDLLREDIDMTLRFVINYNGVKVHAVKDALEKSLRDRLLKTNPETDLNCLHKFGSYFKDDTPLPAGTVIDFRQTADGQLITEIGGNHVGAVQSKDLCRAFFDMYVGDSPVSEQTKEEIGRNVANMIRRN